jgi:hypothetical protein
MALLSTESVPKKKAKTYVREGGGERGKERDRNGKRERKRREREYRPVEESEVKCVSSHFTTG